MSPDQNFCEEKKKRLARLAGFCSQWDAQVTAKKKKQVCGALEYMGARVEHVYQARRLPISVLELLNVSSCYYVSFHI